MKRILALTAILMAFAVNAGAVESFVVTTVTRASEDFNVAKIAWKAAADGSHANGTIPAGVVAGRLLMIVTNPGAVAPADNYDLTILDSNGVDVAGGTLADRDTANSEAVQPLAGSLAYPQGRPVAGALAVTFTNQANANCEGEIYLYFAE
jgi:hypothetical protein